MRVGVVGIGWGTITHVPAFRAVDGYEVAGLCARSEDRLRATAERLDIGMVCTDWSEFVERDELDLISIAAPVEMHHPIALAALRAGKHVLVEKPMALTVAECRDLVDAARYAGTRAAVCYQLRSTPERAAVRASVERGELGTPYWIHVHQTHGSRHPTHPNQALWMYDAEAGGGSLNGVLSHDIDFVCSIFGEVREVFAELRTSVRSRHVDGVDMEISSDDIDVVLLRLDSGALATLTLASVGLHTAGATFEAFGSGGTIRAAIGSRANADSFLCGTPGDQGLQPQPIDARELASGRALPQRGATPLIKAMALTLEDWANAPANRLPPTVPTFADGLRVQTIIDAARRSASRGRWEVPEH